MNPKSFRRELLIGLGSFMAGVALWFPLANWPPSVPGVVVQSKGVGHNSLAAINLPRPADVTFVNEFGLLNDPVPRRAPVKFARPSVFDMPWQQPWVGPYDFLVHPDQKH